ncbi:hypothetical protein A6X21_18605 [Planctopirus hydrillae]|uniref:Uncharacterized protein n=1 Tax=Planctopirus hydrillae TaxID=1841610 RepID=A0A1C3EK01_9PLAN|nr:hypothetical protein A6X21_18605 [Planctopirus hydrillae]
MAGVERLREPPGHQTLIVPDDFFDREKACLQMHACSPTQTPTLAPSPVLTGEGRDEGEPERIEREIKPRLHRELPFIFAL